MNADQKLTDDAPCAAENAGNGAQTDERALQICSFAQASAVIGSADELLASKSFDPKLMFEAMKVAAEKVDGIEYIDGQFKWRIEAVAAEIKRLQKMQKSLKGNRKRLRDYALYCLNLSGGTELPGIMKRLVKSFAKAKLVLESKEASATLYSKYPQFIEQRRVYVWKTDEIRAALEADPELTLPFATLTRTESPRFYPQTQIKARNQRATKKLKEGKAS